MEFGTAKTTSSHAGGSLVTDDSVIEQRLARLLELNAESLRERTIYRSDRERIEASLMIHPIDSKKVFAYFGLMIGTLPPVALGLNGIMEMGPAETGPIVFLILLTAAGIGTGTAGYALGRFVPSAITRIAAFRLPNRVALLALTGFIWGAMSGAIGGLFLFIIGAFFAAIAGGIVGSFALPLFIALRAPVRRGDLTELKHFLPIALGITLSLCAFILGF